MRIKLFTLLFSVVLCARQAAGGLGTTTGAEPRLWTDYHYSVIVAEIRDVRKIPGDGDRPYAATLVPAATIAGDFDASLHPTLSVRFYVSALTSSINRPPQNGTLVLASVVIGRRHADEKEPSDWIDSDLVAFMPGQSGLVALECFADPKVAQTLEKIRAVRGRPVGESGATTRPGTQR